MRKRLAWGEFKQKFLSRDKNTDGEKRLRKSLRFLRNRPRWFVAALFPVALGTVIYEESQSSVIQAQLFSAMASRLSYKVAAGPSSRIVFPQSGPFNEARGYSDIPAFSRRLEDHKFHIVAQSLFSTDLDRLAKWGITPPYREPMSTGLVIRDRNGNVLYDARAHEKIFSDFDDIPPLIVKSLLFVENRELDDPGAETHNPVVDWGRSAKAAFLYAGRKVGLPVPLEGGSTLATQIEKYRYSEDGRTHSATDKLLQMISASIRVYRDGPDTRPQRHEIILDYINSAPLAAAPGFGEVYGLGDGLHAWFGMDLDDVRSAFSPNASEVQQAVIFKHVLALLCATRAPSYYLMSNRPALDARVDFYARQLAVAGLVPDTFAENVRKAPLQFLPHAPEPAPTPYVERKATNAIRARLMKMLDISNLYSLDRLDLTTETTLNVGLQTDSLKVFEKLRDPDFVTAQGLRGQHLLSRGDPAGLTYSFSLFERTPQGNALRVQVDTLNEPFDINEGMKMELGSTAKLRTLAHYLELVTQLYEQFQPLSPADLATQAHSAKDPITQWVVATMRAEPGITLEDVIQASLDRKYSGNPGEVFFTGGGAHVFANFEKSENFQSFTLREGLQKSINLVYIRLMRDLVRYHEARLPYDPDAVLADQDDPDRLRMLQEIADTEGQHFLYEAFEQYHGLTEQEIIDHMLGTKSTSAKKLAVLFLAWHPGASVDDLDAWVQAHGGSDMSEVDHMLKHYDLSKLTLEDFGYLLDRHPLEVWCAGELTKNPSVTWSDLMQQSAQARKDSSQWLFKTKNRNAQDIRLRTKIEEEAFERMLPYWQHLGFPFDHLVPSLATAIGSSADRPIALAELIGIISNDGVRMPMLRVQKLHFAGQTPYETEFEADAPSSERVMNPLVARALKDVLVSVVEGGTAVRVKGAFKTPDGKVIPVGGKTGSGDNRYKTFARGGGLKSARATSRTGTFVFFIGDRYFGVLTAYIAGDKAEDYVFTSALPVAVLKLLAPAIQAKMASEPPAITPKVAEVQPPTIPVKQISRKATN